jgi:hypothetical protein
MTGNKSGLHPLTIAEFTFLPWPARQRFLHLRDGVLRHAPTIGGAGEFCLAGIRGLTNEWTVRLNRFIFRRSRPEVV